MRNKMNINDIIQNYDDVVSGSFRFSCGLVDGTVCMKLGGKVDIQNPDEVLLPVLLRLDKDFVASQVREVDFDIKELEFINSSGIKVVLQMVMSIVNRHESQQYKINFYHDPASSYQKKSFNAITFLAPNLITFIP